MKARLRSHPAARRPVMAAAVAMAVGAVLGMGWAFVPDPAVVLPLVLALGVSLLPFFAPTDYGFDDDGVEVARAGRRERHPWSRFAAFRLVAEGIVLEAAPAPGDFGAHPGRSAAGGSGADGGLVPGQSAGNGWGRRLRGSVFLPMDGDLAARALPLVEQRLPRS